MSRRTIAILAVAAALTFAASAGAKTFMVTKRGDPAPGDCTPGDCSLREAVLAANANPGPDKVLLPNARKSYRLTIPNSMNEEDAGTEGDLDVAIDRVAVVHQGGGRAVIDQRVEDRVLDAEARLNLKRVAVTGGDTGGDGGGIHTVARLILNRSAVTDNSADDAGGIELLGGSLKINRSVLARNRSEDDGGAVRLSGAPAAPSVISSSRFLDNRAVGNPSAHGGAIDVSASPINLTITDSAFRGNRSDETGGAIVDDNTGDLKVRRSTFRNNRSVGPGGALFLSGPDVRIVRSTIAENRATENGGGIQALSGTLDIDSSTISGNRSIDAGGGSSGGGIYLDGPSVGIVNSTVAGNRADTFGGGIHAQDGAELTLNGVTVVRNIASADDEGVVLVGGGGLYRLSSAAFGVSNSLIALNKVGGPNSRARNDCFGDTPFDSNGNNLLSRDCEGFEGDRERSHPRIGKLANNGGPTKTVALKRGSAAIGLADDLSAPNRDQRGRKRDQDPDSGAFERGA